MKKHILLVDDDKDELVIFMDALQRVPADDGFKCTYAANTPQAIEMLKYLVPDYVFADFNMPGMNGLQFLQDLKDQQRLSRAQLCLYSTYISGEVKEWAENLGITCIKKSDTIDSLAKSLGDLFAGEKQVNYSF
jgi:CheY-like chemotaxis protein